MNIIETLKKAAEKEVNREKASKRYEARIIYVDKDDEEIFEQSDLFPSIESIKKYIRGSGEFGAGEGVVLVRDTFKDHSARHGFHVKLKWPRDEQDDMVLSLWKPLSADEINEAKKIEFLG